MSRDLSKVIEKIIKLIPTESCWDGLRSSLDGVRSSSLFGPPENQHLYWNKTSEILNEQIPYPLDGWKQDIKNVFTLGCQEEKSDGGLGPDPMVEMEKVITSDLVSRGKEMLHVLVGVMESTNAVRILRIIENIAKHHRELIATMNGGDTFQAKYGQSSLFGSDATIGTGTNFGNQEENFGAQALKGIVEGFRGVAEGFMNPRKDGRDIKALVEALDLATSRTNNPKMRMIATKLDQKLNKMIDDVEVKDA